VSTPILTDLDGILRRALTHLPADNGEVLRRTLEQALRPALEEALRVALIEASNDMWIGARQISEHIGFSERQTYWMCEQGKLPAFKLAGKWCMRLSTYRAFLSTLDGHFLARRAATTPKNAGLGAG
jgi:hypothetical protein